jgi:hypothetical protein
MIQNEKIVSLNVARNLHIQILDHTFVDQDVQFIGKNDFSDPVTFGTRIENWTGEVLGFIICRITQECGGSSYFCSC